MPALHQPPSARNALLAVAFLGVGFIVLLIAMLM